MPWKNGTGSFSDGRAVSMLRQLLLLVSSPALSVRATRGVAVLRLYKTMVLRAQQHLYDSSKWAPSAVGVLAHFSKKARLSSCDCDMLVFGRPNEYYEL